MIENEMAKLENPDQERFSSCLYPSSASISSSVRTPRCSGSISIGSIPSGTGVLFLVDAIFSWMQSDGDVVLRSLTPRD